MDLGVAESKYHILYRIGLTLHVKVTLSEMVGYQYLEK